VRIRIAAVVAAVAALGASGAAIGAAPAAPRALPTLTGKVGINDAFKISLTSQGKRVKTLKSGFYKLTVTDGSTIHSFVIEGPGLSKQVTSVNFKGTKTVRIHLRKGKYKYYCKPHEATMFGFFTVT
jgi:hypothetical protein